MTTKLYFDAEGIAVGRLGSIVCKELLKGKEVFVINCEKAIVSGDRKEILASMTHWKNLGGKGLKGPKISRVADKLYKRMIRGMLPWDRTRGREAYARLRCYMGNGELTEEELKMAKKIENQKPIKYISLAEVSKFI